MDLKHIRIWILLGLIAGWVARWLMPGKIQGGVIVTIIIGIIGALVGGFLGHLLNLGEVSGFNLWSILLAIGGGVLVLFIYGFLKTKGY